MGDQLKSDVDILKDWRIGHTDEHRDIWRRLEKQGDVNLTVSNAIQRIETKLLVFSALGVIVGNVIASVVIKLFHL